MMEDHFAMDPMGKDTHTLFSKPALLETCADLMATMVPIWMAIAIGLVVGWSWKPRWVSFLVLGLRTRPRLVWSTPPGFGARRLWLSLAAITAFPFLKEGWSKFQSWMWPSPTAYGADSQCEDLSAVVDDGGGNNWAPTTQDLIDLCKKLQCKDGGAQWNLMMSRSVGDLYYDAWRREPLDGEGPTEYKSRTLIENFTVEEARDFFWDDDYRNEWDTMLLYSKTWESCPNTGSMLVQWVRKFPVFCKDREYTIARRMWNSGNMYYCITKGVHYPKVPRQSSPRRVDLYSSSWCIRAVESPLKKDGCLTACEVVLFHREEMGIQRDLAKLGIRQGMWGCVKKMEPFLKKYKEHRKQGKPLSKSALMAQVSTKLPSNFVRTFSLREPSEAVEIKDVIPQKSKGGYLRWLIVGGAVALACGVDKGAVGKILVFGIARRLGRRSVKY